MRASSSSEPSIPPQTPHAQAASIQIGKLSK
jgi:hypothetical protein